MLEKFNYINSEGRLETNSLVEHNLYKWPNCPRRIKDFVVKKQKQEMANQSHAKAYTQS